MDKHSSTSCEYTVCSAIELIDRISDSMSDTKGRGDCCLLAKKVIVKKDGKLQTSLHKWTYEDQSLLHV